MAEIRFESASLITLVAQITSLVINFYLQWWLGRRTNLKTRLNNDPRGSGGDDKGADLA